MDDTFAKEQAAKHYNALTRHIMHAQEEPKVTVGAEMFKLLVRGALTAEKISLLKAGELLGMDAEEIRALSIVWSDSEERHRTRFDAKEEG